MAWPASLDSCPGGRGGREKADPEMKLGRSRGRENCREEGERGKASGGDESGKGQGDLGHRVTETAETRGRTPWRSDAELLEHEALLCDQGWLEG